MIAAGHCRAYGYVFPISIAIVILLAIVTISYEQTIHAYPGGGGAYIVSRDNLGESYAQVAGAALLTRLHPDRGCIHLFGCRPDRIRVSHLDHIALSSPSRQWSWSCSINLRGVKESGMAFAVPTYFFVVMMFITVGIGLFRYFTGSLGLSLIHLKFILKHSVPLLPSFCFMHLQMAQRR